MAVLNTILPQANSSSFDTHCYDHSNDPWLKNRCGTPSESRKAATTYKPVPLYLKRTSTFKPSKPEDFGDGGAFPEIHYTQYPLDMGRRKSTPVRAAKTLPLTMDECGNLRFDAIVKQNGNAKKIVYSHHSDVIPIFAKDPKQEKEMNGDDKQKVIDRTTQETKAAVEKIVNVRLSASQPKNIPTQSTDPKFIKYTPLQSSSAFNSGARERVIRLAEMPVDPMEPPKLKHKRIPKATGESPVPVLQSPPRPATVKDQRDWKIPPCISNWKNPKGYTIPLDKRLAADGRGLRDVQVSDKFAAFAEVLYSVEMKSRQDMTLRAKVQAEMVAKEKERKEKELIELAHRARLERTNVTSVAKEEREERLERENVREERRRERERARRLEVKGEVVGKKRKITRDKDRDVSEKITLGLASYGGKGGEVVMYDQRLFNQEKGMDSGFGADDAYNTYDRGLFTAHSTLSTLYRPKKLDKDNEMYGGNAAEQLDKLKKTKRFKPDRAFEGTAAVNGHRDGPVEFEKKKQQPEEEEEDIFGLDKYFTEVDTGIKKAMDRSGFEFDFDA